MTCLFYRCISWSVFSIKKRFYWHRKGYLPPNIEPGIYPFPRKQVPIEGIKSYEERINELMPQSKGLQELESVDIGFAFQKPPSLTARMKIKNDELEAQARMRTLKISIDSVHDIHEDFDAPIRRLTAAEHYGIFDSTFGPPHMFTPLVDVAVYYEVENGNPDTSTIQPVLLGNHLTPSSVKNEPLVDLSQLPKNHLWTIIMTSPDEPLPGENGTQASEYIHWMIANVSSETSNGLPLSGDLIVPYFQPLPYYGTGFHRFVFLLYHQDRGTIDLTSERRQTLNKDPLQERTFSTAEFYRLHQHELTPAGLAFFQSTWDLSVRNFYRTSLKDLSEPIFEIQWPEPLPPPQSRYPKVDNWIYPRRHPDGLPLACNRLGVHENVSFDVYLDRYRDRKDLNTEIILERLASEGNPLNSNESSRRRLRFPMAVPIPDGVPSWWKKQETQRRLRMGRWRLLDGHED